MSKILALAFLFAGCSVASAQIQWSADGNAYTNSVSGNIVRTTLPGSQTAVVVSKQNLINPATRQPIAVAAYAFSSDSTKVLIFTNTARVWRDNTRGDYWLLNRSTNQFRQLGKNRPGQSLMFAKLSPDGQKVAYVSEQNLYVEDLTSGQVVPLTTDGTRKQINGTFDWAYEEEFFCRDGFRWSPDSKQIAYWQIDASGIRDYLMLNTTDSTYSFTIPVEYPKVGETPSSARIGVVNAAGGSTTWLKLPGDPRQHYLIRMEWTPDAPELIVQQMNRKQNQTTLFIAKAADGTVQPIYTEKNQSWVDPQQVANTPSPELGWWWTEGGKSFLWLSEKDGWRHLYRISRDGKKETLLTPGAYDVARYLTLDEKANYVYLIASPDNATQRYLYRIKADGKGTLQRLSPADQPGTHNYSLSPNGQLASHSFSSHRVAPVQEWVHLPDHKPISTNTARVRPSVRKRNVEFFTVTTDDGITLDGWMAKPVGFDSTKKYPVLFYVYGEPWSVTTNDNYQAGVTDNFDSNTLDSNYCYVALDNRGTPTLKGAAWRKAIYRQIGRVNIRDQAMGTKKLLQQRPYLDPSRVAVWGWSGGGATTLHLLFQYPDIYQTGIAVAAVTNQLLYDNIYQERYMGLPQENREDFVAGSPITYAKNLRGNLLYVHGTGDDNVHYANSEQLVNELVRHNKQFQLMAYPNRSHGIGEGAGTREHLRTLFTKFLLAHCPPGAR
ncbi:S9 family peptidase [Nibrella saemangeumensis]|uniref:S9 family peptidase n=1 Tax=Nibrella saemangeumensis TaxID=1084526 RepID=A0ABP8NFZ1_9BACT